MNENYNDIKTTMAKLCANNLSGVNNRAIDKLAAQMMVYIISSSYGIKDMTVEKIFGSEQKAKQYLKEQKEKYPFLTWHFDIYEVEE